MFSKAWILSAAVLALSAVSGVHVVEKMSLQHKFKWVDDTVTPTLTYFTVANMGDGNEEGAGDGHSDGQENHQQGPPLRSHGGWNGEGVLEVQSGSNCDFPDNRTTVPVGHCVRNVLAPKGDFMVLLMKTAGNGTYTLGAQGFSDAHCAMPVGQPLKAPIMNGCRNGVGMQLASHRTPHPMGITTRVYHKDSCNGGHIDFWVPDSYCGDGTMFSHGSKSYVASCENDYVVEYGHDGCMGTTTYHALHEMDLGLCHTTHQGTYEVVCGGMPAPVWTGPPTMMPSTGEFTDYIIMDSYVKYHGSVASGEIVRYSFDWKPEMMPSFNGSSVEL
jgi:hypothetical protein